MSDDLRVNWDAVSWNGDIGSYEILRSVDGSSYSQIATVSSGTTYYDDTALLDGEQYSYKVRATNSAGSSTSTASSGTTALPAPSQLSADQIAPKSVDLSWVNHHNNGTMKVQYKKSSNTTWNDFSTGLGTSVNSEEITGLSETTQYDARVVLSTEHKNHEDVVVSNAEQITVQSPYVVDSKDVIRGTLTVQE